jgi:hypothetical protein
MPVGSPPPWVAHFTFGTQNQFFGTLEQDGRWDTTYSQIGLPSPLRDMGEAPVPPMTPMRWPEPILPMTPMSPLPYGVSRRRFPHSPGVWSILAATNKFLARINKSRIPPEATKKRRAPRRHNPVYLETSYEAHSTGGDCCSGSNGRTS